MSNVRLFLKKASSGNEVALTGDLTIGRGPESGLKLTEGRPSRKHARLTVSDGSAWLEDLGSTNGTFVNGVRIQSKVKLNSGDRVRFDMEEFVFRVDPGTADAERTVLREASAAPAAATVRANAPDTPAIPAVIAAPPGVPKPTEVKAVVAESGRSNVPPVWAEGGGGGGSKTVFKTIEEMEEERKRARASASDAPLSSTVDVPHLVLAGTDGPVIVQLHASDPDKKEWLVGSDPGREIRIERSDVSGLHAKIVSSGKRWKVVDQVSANGTFVNGKRSTVSYLHSGDRIAFGSLECVFRLPEGFSSSAALSTRSQAGSTRGRKILIIAVLSFIATLALLAALVTWLG